MLVSARRRAASRKVKQMKQCSKDTEDMENEDNEDLFADIGQLKLYQQFCLDYQRLFEHYLVALLCIIIIYFIFYFLHYVTQ